MNRLSTKFCSTVICIVTSASLLAACGGGGGSHASPLPLSPPTNAPATTYTGPLADANFTITIPAPPKASGKLRSPAYVSSATTKVVFALNSSTNPKLATAPQLSAYNTSQLGAKAVTLNSAQCPGTGPWTCTIPIKLPPGSDNITVMAEDGSNNVLSQQVQTFSVVAGTANSLSMTLDANANTISLSGTQACTQGAIQGTFGSTGTSPVTINVTYTDLAGKTIVSPGAPKIGVQDADSTFHTASGTINATGGTVSYTINQAARTVTLTPSTVPVSNATVVVRGAPANSTGSSDNLVLTPSHTFTFSAGVAPPAHNFLAIVEQNRAATSGQVNFFNLSLGGAGAADSLSPFAPAPTLATTTSINAAPDGQQPDVDNPEGMTFDAGGNLLIANGGAGGVGGDFGNFACVPAGSISTGSALATTNRTNLRVPDAIAVSSNGTVAIANNPAGATTKLEEFVLGVNYTAGSSIPDDGSMTMGVPLGRPLVDLPTLTPGTFAVAITNGTTNSRIDILGPTGVIGSITTAQDANLQDPFGMAWDPVNSQLVVANNHGHFSNLNFYTVANPPATPVDVKSFGMQPDPDPADDCPGGTPCFGLIGQRVAVAPGTGTVAVSGINAFNSPVGAPEVQLYDATPSRNPVPNGVIPFDTFNTAANACNDGSTGALFGSSDIIRELRWLSSTKLMVLLDAPNLTSAQGIYIFDTSVRNAQPAGFWGPFSGGSCVATAPPLGPKQTFFQSTSTLIPFAAAFEP